LSSFLFFILLPFAPHSFYHVVLFVRTVYRFYGLIHTGVVGVTQTSTIGVTQTDFVVKTLGYFVRFRDM
jgi:hypothetical protein